MLRTISVKLSSISMVVNFTNINQDTDCDVKVKASEHVSVQGDSIMGLFAINLLEPLVVDIEGDKENINDLMQKYDEAGIIYTDGTEINRADTGTP